MILYLIIFVFKISYYYLKWLDALMVNTFLNQSTVSWCFLLFLFCGLHWNAICPTGPSIWV